MKAPDIETNPRSSEVIEALESTRRAMRRYRVGLGFVALVLAGLALLIMLVVADVTWVLPFAARALGLLGLAVLGVAGLVRVATARGLKYGRGDAAIEVESAFPELGQAVRTTLEYDEPGPGTATASRSLVQALTAQTDRNTRGLEFASLVPWGRFTRLALVMVALVMGVLVALAHEPNLRVAVCRVLLQPLHYTTIDVEPGDKTIKAGSAFDLGVTIKGRPVPSAVWRWRAVDKPGVWTSSKLEMSAIRGKGISGTVQASIQDCQADFDYQVSAGEVESPVYHVNVNHPLMLKSLEATIDPPSYTRRPRSVVTEGNFPALEGSRVRFKINLDRPPATASLTTKAAEGSEVKTWPLTVQGSELTGELSLASRDVSYEIHAKAADGMTLEPLGYRIKVRPDGTPTIRFLKPTETYAATATTEIPIKVEASDDFGVARVGIVYQVNDGPEQSLYLDNPRDQPLSVEALSTLFLENHKLTYNDSLTYRAFAEDNRPVNPQRANTDLRFIDILPYKQMYQMADSSGGGGPPGASLSLEELITRQRLNLNRTFAHVDDSPVDPKVADRLSRAEAELALATQEFTARLTRQFGPAAPLELAFPMMTSATSSLAERDFPTAVTLQKRALDSLIQARQNLRKLLTDPKTASQGKQFDNQQNQKLRKPPQTEAKTKEAELARLEEDVKKLAADQKRFAEDLEPRAGDNEAPEPNADPSKKPGASPKPSPSARQAGSAREADRLKSLARQDPDLTPLTQSRMDEAAGRVKEAEASIEQAKAPEAAEAARKASKQLDRLADQIAALKSKDLADRLARAREMAQSTAKGERELADQAKGGTPADKADRQEKLAEQAEALADVLQKLSRDAIEEDKNLARELGLATESNAPGEIERSMRQAGEKLAKGEGTTSIKQMEAAAGRLEALARDVETARRGFVQPQLEQLIATERQAAEVARKLQSVGDASRKAEAEKAMGELSKALDALKSADGSIQQAAQALALAGGNGSWTQPSASNKLREGLFTPPPAYDKAVGSVARALQAKIQSMILNEAVVDRDGAVPPGYKQLVQDYYRVLSEDLR